MLTIDAWLTRNETTGIESHGVGHQLGARRVRNVQRARAVERQLRWRAKARNRQKFNRYQLQLMQRRRRLAKLRPHSIRSPRVN